MANDAERNAMPGGGELIVAQEAEIMNPAPFMRALGSRDYGTGNVYEMRTYTYAPGDLPKVLEAWAKAVPAREELSPLAACWTSELGGLNKFVHTWVYKNLGERERIRAASRAPGQAWPPQTGVRPIRQENKLLIPASVLAGAVAGPPSADPPPAVCGRRIAAVRPLATVLLAENSAAWCTPNAADRAGSRSDPSIWS